VALLRTLSVIICAIVPSDLFVTIDVFITQSNLSHTVSYSNSSHHVQNQKVESLTQKQENGDIGKGSQAEDRRKEEEKKKTKKNHGC
jgi:hypothetical protein